MRGKRALTFEYGATLRAAEYARRYNLDLTVLPRGSVMYRDMPDLLRSFDWYLDIKRGRSEILPALSMTGLQALACGLEVIRYDGELVSVAGPPIVPEPKRGVFPPLRPDPWDSLFRPLRFVLSHIR